MDILLIFSDQQHKYALGKVDPQYLTPNLDRLAEEGVLFTSAYSNNPVCGPFRGCLMTGQYTTHCKVYKNNEPLPEGVPTIASTLRRMGWQTAFTGKWHLGGKGNNPIPEALRGGFERFSGYQCYNGFEPSPPFSNEVVFYDEENRAHPYQIHRTEATTQNAQVQLRSMCRDHRPFFCMVGYQAPHYPEQPSPKFAELYRDVEFSKPPDYQDTEPYTPTFNPPSPKDRSQDPDYRSYGGNMAEYRKLYAAMVSQVDDGVGRIIDELKQQSRYENTMIIYMSDHGDMQGSHGLTNKCVPYEKSAGIPLIIRMPKGLKGQRCSALVSGVDVSASILDAAGVELPKGCDGISLLPLVTGEGPLLRDFVITESTQGAKKWRMIRQGPYKLVTSFEGYVPELLFDMEKDPYEMENILNQAEHGLVQGLLHTLKQQTM